MQIHFIHEMVLVELYSTELKLKQIEKCERIQKKKRFHIFMSARLRKRN